MVVESKDYEEDQRYIDLQYKESSIEDEIDRRDDSGLSKEDLMQELDEVRAEMDKVKSEYEAEDKFCSICGDPILGYGNSANPVNDEVCCDTCNLSVVVPARLKLANQQENVAESKDLKEEPKAESCDNQAVHKRFRKKSVKEASATFELIEPEADEARIPAPVASDDSNLANTINRLIQDEWEAIEGYNKAIEEAKVEGKEEIIAILNEISNDEHKHVGSLEYALSLIAPQAESIKAGEEEAKEVETPQEENLNGPDMFSNALESLNKDPEDVLKESYQPVFGESAVDNTDYASLLEKYYGKEAVDFAKEKDLSAKGVYFYMECHAAYNPLITLKEELENVFSKEEFEALYE